VNAVIISLAHVRLVETQQGVNRWLRPLHLRVCERTVSLRNAPLRSGVTVPPLHQEKVTGNGAQAPGRGAVCAGGLPYQPRAGASTRCPHLGDFVRVPTLSVRIPSTHENRSLGLVPSGRRMRLLGLARDEGRPVARGTRLRCRADLGGGARLGGPHRPAQP
jgi:hypothetical protein